MSRIQESDSGVGFEGFQGSGSDIGFLEIYSIFLTFSNGFRFSRIRRGILFGLLFGTFYESEKFIFLKFSGIENEQKLILIGVVEHQTTSKKRLPVTGRNSGKTNEKLMFFEKQRYLLVVSNSL